MFCFHFHILLTARTLATKSEKGRLRQKKGQVSFLRRATKRNSSLKGFSFLLEFSLELLLSIKRQ